MLQTRLYLTCDGCGDPHPRCGNCPSPVDGAIFDAQQVRREAAKVGWSRPYRAEGRGLTRVDLCQRCTKKEQRKGGK